MVELKQTLGIKTFADIQVYRDGKLRDELKECGNDILDNWFALWIANSYHTAPAVPGYVKLGEGGGPTSLSMTTLEASKLLNGSSAYGVVYTGSPIYTNSIVNENGNNYVIYEMSMLFFL